MSRARKLSIACPCRRGGTDDVVRSTRCRAPGATPFTADEQNKLHAQHAATYVANALIAVGDLAGALGGGGANAVPLMPTSKGAEPLQRALSAADDRIDGLLRIRSNRSCAGRSTLQAETTDVHLWRTLEADRVTRKGAPGDDKASVAWRTAVFDQLGPKPVQSQ